MAPESFKNKFPEGLLPGPLLACLVALTCCTLPGFHIEALPLPEILLYAGDSGDDNSGNDDSGDNTENESNALQGGDLAIIQGPGGSLSEHSYRLGYPFDGLELHVLSNRPVCVWIYCR